MVLIPRELVTTGKFIYHAIAAIVLLFTINPIHAQDLKSQKWEHRIILILSNDSNSSKTNDQLTQFSNRNSELLERKILIYLITPESTVILDEFLEEKVVVKDKHLWKKHHSKDEPFIICLIGLDGGTKFTSYEVTKPSEIFDLIDSMPMRRSELRSGK